MSLFEMELVHEASKHEKERLFNEDGERDMRPNMAVGFYGHDSMIFPPLADLEPLLDSLGMPQSLGQIAGTCIDAIMFPEGKKHFKLDADEIPNKVYFVSDGYTRTIEADIPDKIPEPQTMAEAFAMQGGPEPINMDLHKDFSENPFTDVKECLTSLLIIDDLVGDYEVWSIQQPYVVGEHGVFVWENPIIVGPDDDSQMEGAVVDGILGRLRYYKERST